MNIAFCYESVLPARGGCETYIADLARRLRADRHDVHLYACQWDESALAPGIHYHPVPAVRGPRFLRPWRFGRHCLEAMKSGGHDVTVGFDKTWGQDILYPQGGLHVASAEHNVRKHASPVMRGLARLTKTFDLASWSFARLERRQYLGKQRPLIVVNSFMVRDHFQHYYGMPADNLHVVRSSIDPGRFPEHDRPKVRQEARAHWGIRPEESVALLAAMNYRLKGLEPLLHAVARLVREPQPPFRLLVAGNAKTARYQRLADRLGISPHVLFLGHCPDIRHAYFAADFLVHPTFYDPCSLVVLEALGCGVPVITTRYNGASELMTPPEEGYVIDDPHDHDHLAWCLRQLLDGRRRAGCSQAARRAASQWTFESHYQQLCAVLQKAKRRKQAA